MIILSTQEIVKKKILKSRKISIHIITALSEGDSRQGSAFECLEVLRNREGKSIKTSGLTMNYASFVRGSQ